MFLFLYAADAFPRGLALLNHLHAHMQAFNAEDVAAHVSELTAWLLVKSSEPILLVMSEYISRGRVSKDADPFVGLLSMLIFAWLLQSYHFNPILVIRVE